MKRALMGLAVFASVAVAQAILTRAATSLTLPSTPEHAAVGDDLACTLEFDLSSKSVPALCVVEGTIRVRCNAKGVVSVDQAWFDDSESETKAFLCITEHVVEGAEAPALTEMTIGWLGFGSGFSANVKTPDEEPCSIWHTLEGLGYGSGAQRLQDGGTLEMVVPVGVRQVPVDPDVVGGRSLPGVLFRQAGAVYAIHIELRKAAEVLLASTPTVVQVVGNGLEPAMVGAAEDFFAKNRCAWMLLGLNAFGSPARQLTQDHRLVAEDALEFVPSGSPVHEALTMLCVECDLDRPMRFVRENKPGTEGFASGVLAELASLADCKLTIESLVHLPITQPCRTSAAKARVAHLTEALSK